MINRYFVLDGESSMQYGISMQGHPSFSAPTPKIEKVTVPGRNGDLISFDGSYSNVQAEIPCFILKDSAYDFIAEANTWLSIPGYRRLTYDGDEEAYRLARITNLAEVSVSMHVLNPFVLKFECKPQRFLMSGEQTIEMSASGSIFCPGFGGLPLIRIYGAGTVTLNEKSIVVTSVNEYVDVDCDTQNAYKLGDNKNSTIQCADFPKMQYGENVVTISSGISKIEITPRWFTL